MIGAFRTLLDFRTGMAGALSLSGSIIMLLGWKNAMASMNPFVPERSLVLFETD
jgi:hypothetical protein